MSNSPSDKQIKLPGQEPDGMQERMLLALALIGVLLMGMQYFMPSAPPAPAPPPAKSAPAAATTAATPKPDQPAPTIAAGTGKSATAAAVTAAQEQTAAIETELYKVVFTNRGAAVRSWILKKYKDSNGAPLELVNPASAGRVVLPLSVRFHTNQSAEELNSALYAMTVSPDRSRVDFQYSQGGWFARKSIAFAPDSYLSRVSSEVSNSGAPKPHLLYWRGGFGDSTVLGAAATQLTLRHDATSGFNQLTAPEIANAQAHRGRFTFAGITDAFFAAVALPEAEKDFEIHSMSDQLENPFDKKLQANAGMAVGGSAVNQFQFFVGPKDTKLLASISPRLPRLVDFGYFGLIAEPLFLALRWLNNNLVHNYGWAIVVATVIINFALLPLKISSLKSMKQMSALQPQMVAINEKFKGISMTDPRAAKKNEEMMALYKKHGVSPTGGCVPMMLQIPFFIAFYKVLSSAIELRGASWLWVSDLSQPETLALRMLPLVMVASQVLMQKMTPQTSMDPAQQKMMMILMPVMMGFMFWGASSGLVLYWMTGNLVGIAQQWFFNRMFPASPAPAAVAPAAPLKKK